MSPMRSGDRRESCKHHNSATPLRRIHRLPSFDPHPTQPYRRVASRLALFWAGFVAIHKETGVDRQTPRCVTMVIVSVHMDRRGGYKEVPIYRPAPRRTLNPDERQRLEAEHRRLNAAAEKQAGIARHLREVQMVPPGDLHRKQQAVRLELAQRREKKIRFAACESAGIARRYGAETALLKLYGDAVHNIANSAVQRVHLSHEAQPLTSERVHALFHRTPPDAAAPRVLSRPSPKRLQGDTEASDYFMPHFGAPPMQQGLHATLALQRASSAGRVRPGTSRNVEHPYQRGSGRPSSRPSSAPVVSSSGALEMKATQTWQELIFQRGRKAKEEYNKAFLGKTRPSSAASERTSEAAAALAAREAAIAARAQELKEKMAALKAAKDAGDITVPEYAQAISKLRQEHQAAEQAAEAARTLEETTQEYFAREQELAKRLSKGGSPPSAAELAHARDVALCVRLEAKLGRPPTEAEMAAGRSSTEHPRARRALYLDEEPPPAEARPAATEATRSPPSRPASRSDETRQQTYAEMMLEDQRRAEAMVKAEELRIRNEKRKTLDIIEFLARKSAERVAAALVEKRAHESAAEAALKLKEQQVARRAVADEAARIVGMAVMKALERAAGPWPQREAPRRPYA